MSFNHRLVEHEIDKSIGIYEIYYNNEGSIINITKSPIIVGNDLEDLKGELNNLLTAFKKPILKMNMDGKIKREKK